MDPSVKQEKIVAEAVSTLVRFAIFIFFFLLASTGTAMTYHDVTLFLYGTRTEAVVIKTEEPRGCFVPPNFKCTYSTLELETKDNKVVTIKEDMISNVSAGSYVPILYLENNLKFISLQAKLNYDILSSVAFLVIGCLGMIFLKPVKVIKEFSENFAYGLGPILIPETSEFFKSTALKNLGMLLLLLIIYFLIQDALRGGFMGLFWAPIIVVYFIYLISYFGYHKINTRYFIIPTIFILVYLYFFWAYLLLHFL